MPQEFKQLIKEFIQLESLIEPRDHLLIGLSGGPDSTALLHILHQLKHDIGFQLSAAHVNHQTRDSSRTDQIHVENVCKEMNIPLFIHVWEDSSPGKSDFEQRARKERLVFFQKIFCQANCSRLALGHTEDDQAETFLLRLIRGSGMQGLSAIWPKRYLENMIVIRPLLNTSKQAILDYLDQNHIVYLNDPSNLDPKHARNKIRHDLLPHLRKHYNPGIMNTISRNARSISLDVELLNQLSSEAFEKCLESQDPTSIRLRIEDILQLDPALRARVFRETIFQLQGHTQRIEFDHISQIDQMIRKPLKKDFLNLPKGLIISKNVPFIVFAQN